MGRSIYIGRNLYIDDSAGLTDYKLVSELLSQVSDLFDTLTGIKPSHDMYIFRLPGGDPHCQWIGRDTGIFLVT